MTELTKFIGVTVDQLPSDPSFSDSRLATAADPNTGKLYKVTTSQWIDLLSAISVASQGAASPSTDPGTPEKGQYWIATEAGTYTNFLDSTSTAIEVSSGEFAILSYDGTAWTKQVVTIDLSGYVATTDIDSLPDGKNLFNKDTVNTGVYIRPDGTVTSSSQYSASDFIPVSAGNYTGSATWSGSTRIRFSCFYDAGKNVVTGGVDGNQTAVTVPAGVAFVRLTIAQGDADTFQFEKGTTATAYEPYKARATNIGGYEIPFTDPDQFYTKSQTDEKIPAVGYVPGKNIANPDRIITGYISTTQDAGFFATSRKSIIIPAGAGLDYTISGWASIRNMIGFYKGTVPAAGSAPPIGVSADLITSGTTTQLGIDKTAGVATVTTPANTTYIVITIMDTTEDASVYSSFMVEKGDKATDYEPYNGSDIVNKINTKEIAAQYLLVGNEVIPAADAISQIPINGMAVTVNNDSGQATLAYEVEGKKISQVLDAFKVASLDNIETGHFDWAGTKVDGILAHILSDEEAPYRVMGTTIGGTHGYEANRLTMSAHGKTNADVGSVWSDGSKQFVLINVKDANTLDVSSKSDNTSFSASSLTHVSGAAHTGTITPTANTALKMVLYSKNHSVKMLIDGYETAANDGTYGATKNVTFIESYDILEKNSIMTWLISKAGTSTKITSFDGTAVISVSITYSFDNRGGCTIYTDFLALDDISAFQDIMFVMSNSLPVGSKFYIPKSLPFTQDSVSYDFRVLQAPGSPVNRLNFDPTRCLSTGILCDRLVMLNEANGVGFALGYLPVKDAAPDVRRTNASNKALQISEANKAYMSCIDGLQYSLSKGDYFSAICYKNYFFKSVNRTDQYVVQSNVGNYLYVDWHTTIAADRVNLPSDLAGKDYTVVEKSSGVNVLSGATNSIVFGVTVASGGYEYAILKF